LIESGRINAKRLKGTAGARHGFIADDDFGRTFDPTSARVHGFFTNA
jgi:hypothetical protein